MPELEVVERSVDEYKNDSSQFVIKPDMDYRLQYYVAYTARLNLCLPRLHKVAQDTWPDVPLLDLSTMVEGIECVVAGIIVKNQKLRPSVLKELAEDINELPQPVQGLFTNEKDTVDIEDLQQRIILTGNIDPHQLVTGIPVALYGRQEDRDYFHVIDCKFMPKPDFLPEIKRDEDKYVMIISGLHMTGREGDDGRKLMAAQLMADWLTGSVGINQANSIAPRICRVVIAGNLISRTAQDNNLSKQARYLTRKNISPSVECVRNVDRFLSTLTSVIPCDVMPGLNDPTTHLLPQQPLHKCIFPKSAMFNSFNLVTNPYKFHSDKRVFVGSSGQNMDDIRRYSDAGDKSAGEKLMEWQHLCPTCPDTVDGFPLTSGDPLVMEAPLPDVIFAGNQPKLHWTYTESQGRKQLILEVPSFSSSACAVAVRLSDLHVQPLHFTTEFDELCD